MPRDARDPLTLVVLVTPSFNLSATMGFVDPFRAANYLEGQVLFRWMFVSETGGPVRASNGTSIDTQSLSDAPEHPDFVVVSSSWTPEVFAPPADQGCAAALGAARRNIGRYRYGRFHFGRHRADDRSAGDGPL